MKGVKPSSSEWKSEIIIVIPHPHMVTLEGFEPSIHYRRGILSAMRIPVPPQSHILFLIRYNFIKIYWIVRS